MTRIGIDIQPLMGPKTGVGHYTFNLIKALSRVDKKDKYKLILFRFFTKPIDTLPIDLPKNFSYGIIKILPGRVFAKLLDRNLLPPVDMFLGKRVYIFPNFVCWPLIFSKSLVVIYDLSFVRYPEYTSPKNLRYLRRNVPKSISRASRIITISQNSKNEIVEHYKISHSRVSIVSPAVDHDLFKPQLKKRVEHILHKYKINRSYILSVCTIEPRKNLIGVLEAFSLLPENIKNKYTLVLVGGKGWLDGEIQKKYNELSAKYNVIKTGYVKDNELPALYTGASVFVYPSFYEGFGMPPLEAMACGVPVITSDNSSLPEVVGDAAIKVKAEDTKNLARRMQEVLENKELAKDMREKGLKQSKKFTWSKSADKLIEVINEVAR